MKSFGLKQLLACFFACIAVAAYSQEVELGSPEVLQVRKRQWDLYADLHTNGFGGGGRIDKIHSIKLRSGFDMEYTYYRHFKEQKISINGSRSLVYGKKNYFGELRFGYGCTRVLNTRPYSGGVEVGYFFYGGAAVGFSLPVYLNVYYIENDELTIQQVQYDPQVHVLSSIESKAPMWKGFKKLKVHPGIYAKTGLGFDFSTDDALVVNLEIGLACDLYFIPVEKMAFNPKQYYLLMGFVAIHLGRRLTNYE